MDDSREEQSRGSSAPTVPLHQDLLFPTQALDVHAEVSTYQPADITPVWCVGGEQQDPKIKRECPRAYHMLGACLL